MDAPMENTRPDEDPNDEFSTQKQWEEHEAAELDASTSLAAY